MKREEINRAFAEALLRLRRDSINFKKLGIDKQLVLYINNEDNHSSTKNITLITFDTGTSLWELNHNGIVTKNWKAPLSELIGILNLYETSEILQSIQSLEESTYIEFCNINSIALESKVIQLMNILHFEENNIEPHPVINLGDVFKIWFDFDDSCFKLWRADDGSETLFEEFMLKSILININYATALYAIRKTFSQLARRI